MKYQYRLYNYGVIGNKGAGFEVNDVYRTNEIYELDPDNLKDSVIIKELKKQCCIKLYVKSKLIEIEGDKETLYFSYKGRPQFELRVQTERNLNE